MGIGVAGLVAGGLTAFPARAAIRQDLVSMALSDLGAARHAAGLADLAQCPALTQAAALQAAYIARKGTAIHNAEDGGDPAQRARTVGYPGRVLGEALAETFEGPSETVAFWLAHDWTRPVLLDPAAREAGLVMHRGKDGRMWWDLLVGVRGSALAS